MMMEFNSFSILSWNIRGAANLRSNRHMKELIRKHHPSLIMLMETHIHFNSVHGFWHQQGYEVIAIEEARGHYVDICLDRYMCFDD